MWIWAKPWPRWGEWRSPLSSWKRAPACGLFHRDIQKSLVYRYLTLKQIPQAHEALKRYVALFPQDTFMQGALAQMEGRR